MFSFHQFLLKGHFQFIFVVSYKESINRETLLCLIVLLVYSFPNVSTTPIMAMGCRQCLPLSVVHKKSKHYQKPHCRNGVVDTFGPWQLCRNDLPQYSLRLVSDSSLHPPWFHTPMKTQVQLLRYFKLNVCSRAVIY